MKPYLLFSLKSFSVQLSYRAEVWLRLLGNVLGIFIQIAIWKAVMYSGQTNGISFEQMITYTILNSFLSIMLLTDVYTKVGKRLKSGDIAIDFIKPLRYPFFLLFDRLGTSLYQLMFIAIPTLVAACLLFGIQQPASSAHFIAFLAASLIALLVSFLLGYLIALIAFWFLTLFSLEWMLGGYFAHDELISILGAAVVWVAILMAIVAWLWNRAVRRMVVQGG